MKRHYVIFVAACLIAAFLAAEFTGSLNFSTAQNYEETYEQVQSDLNGEGTYKIKTKVDSIGWMDVIRIMTEDDMQAGREMSREIRQNAIEDSENGNPMFGRTRGVFTDSSEHGRGSYGYRRGEERRISGYETSQRQTSEI